MVLGFSAQVFPAPPSLPAGLILLRPLARELGLTLDAKHDDLPAIARYYVNNSSGNRGPLIQHIREVLGRSAEPSTYHREVARSSVVTIWTTNYDGLMEQALAGLKFRVRVRESDMVEMREAGAVEIIKAHGSFGISKPGEFVIASEDYEDYARNRPTTTARLQGDLLSKSFLFVGYAYGDPNIQAVLVEARRLAERATLPHWMLTTAVDGEKDAEAARRQKLWKMDLNRIGILTTTSMMQRHNLPSLIRMNAAAFSLSRLAGQTTCMGAIGSFRRCPRRAFHPREVRTRYAAPDLVKAAIDGRLPHGMGVALLRDLPAEWPRQNR